jgi:predicted kinase
MKKIEHYKREGSLLMMISISGSGKSYYIKNKILNDFPKIQEILDTYNIGVYDLVVCPDDIRREVTGDVSNITKDAYVWRLAKDRTNEKIKTYGFCIFDATNVVNKSRRNFMKTISCTRRYAVVLKPDLELSKERIKQDIVNGVDRSNVPMFVIDRQYNNFKTNLIGDENWDGSWDSYAKAKIKATLQEFDEVKFGS